MPYIPRALTGELKRAAPGFSGLIVTGPRRSGKTTLLRKVFPQAEYYLLEDPDVVARVKSDPRTFLDDISGPAILDEIQNTPELLNYIRARIDANPGKKGRWFLTGSQEAPLMMGVTESMAGRVAVFHLLPLSLAESSAVTLAGGGFPEAAAGRPGMRGTWFRSYIQTYLERDVRAVSSIRDLSTFRRFLGLLASRCGQMINRTELAAPLGVSVPTISEWLSILEVTGQIILVPPFYENFGKRIVKSPKLYFVDSGLACHLLGIGSAGELRRSPFLGPIFEGFIASEIIKHQLNSGRRRELYWFRDRQGMEVDFVVPGAGRHLVLIEAKASRTIRPSMGAPLIRLSKSISKKYTVSAYVVGDIEKQAPAAGVCPGVRLVTPRRLGEIV